ncbi:phage tail protein [Salmonella enterica subsp. enterica]|nr:phage tail protein [Salmonella enterica subsp. enterica serovar Poona]EBW2889679.1 phage tail protein [Salmonella enterica subsp. enterica serovar Poona]ECD3711296.1 phage tail protein [Salmonella enterica subsp. enterica serovar Poona]ECG6029196.1 phage tail protein [Salmonella enterica subsp. enterica serovar Poona]ECH9318923.1 phage tail protein [Salmonella enterica subsp. enterica serovar Poona]
MSSRVELFISGKIFAGWVSVSVRRSLEHLAGSFELTLMLPGRPVPDAITPGQPLRLTINGVTVITGYLDTVKHKMSATSSSINVTGRDKTGDLVDCSAVFKGSQWHGRTLEQIARDLCQPFGIRVVWQVDDATAAKPFATFTLQQAETVSDALTRAARHRGVLVTSNAGGDLVFTQAGTQQTDTLELGKNLLDADFTDDWRNRYSEYLVKGHGGGGGHKGEAKAAALLAAPKGTTDDKAVTRWRPKVILADHKITADGARQRAIREERRAIAKSERFIAGVKGWFRESGALWDVNLLTRVVAPRVGVDKRDLLVCQVEFTLNGQNGEVTRLTLAPRDGFIVPAEPDSSGTGGEGGGVDAWVLQRMKEQGIKFDDK